MGTTLCMLLTFLSTSSFPIILITFSSCNLQNIPAVVNVTLLFSCTQYIMDMKTCSPAIMISKSVMATIRIVLHVYYSKQMTSLHATAWGL